MKRIEYCAAVLIPQYPLFGSGVWGFAVFFLLFINVLLVVFGAGRLFVLTCQGDMSNATIYEMRSFK